MSGSCWTSEVLVQAQVLLLGAQERCCSALSGPRCPLPHLSGLVMLAGHKPRGPEGVESHGKAAAVPGGGNRR